MIDTNANAVGKFILFYEGTTTTPRNPVFMAPVVYKVVNKKGSHKLIIEHVFTQPGYQPVPQVPGGAILEPSERTSALAGGHIALDFNSLDAAKIACELITRAKEDYDILVRQKQIALSIIDDPVPEVRKRTRPA